MEVSDGRAPLGQANKQPTSTLCSNKKKNNELKETHECREYD
jgi:hypothetical protein